METTMGLGFSIHQGYIGIMGKKMEPTIVQKGICWGCKGIMEKNMETTMVLAS